MSQFKKESELHHAWANWLDMCEGTEVNVNSGWRWVDRRYSNYKPMFDDNPENYKIAIGIVENKPVFIGDELYNHNGGKLQASAVGFTWHDKEARNSWLKSLSWSPPKPNKAMVELSLEDISFFSLRTPFNTEKQHWINFYAACRKTLENLK